MAHIKYVSGSMKALMGSIQILVGTRSKGQTAALERDQPANETSPFIFLTARVPLGHPRTACPKPLSDAKATPRNFIPTKFIQLAWGLESLTWATTTLTHIAVSQKGDPHGP